MNDETATCAVCQEFDWLGSEAVYLAQAATARADNFDYEGYDEAHEYLAKVTADFKAHRTEENH